MIALFDRDLGQFACGVGADVDVLARLDFARGGDQAGEILPHGVPGLHRYDAAPAIANARKHGNRAHHQHSYGDENFPFTLQCETAPLNLDADPRLVVHKLYILSRQERPGIRLTTSPRATSRSEAVCFRRRWSR